MLKESRMNPQWVARFRFKSFKKGGMTYDEKKNASVCFGAGFLESNQVDRAALIASVPGDEESVAVAVAQHPERFVGFFMVNPTQGKTVERIRWAVGELGLRCICLFPAMHRFQVYEDKAIEVFETAASLDKAVVFVHCGVLSLGVRKKLGLASRFAMRFSNPLDLHSVALSYPELPMIPAKTSEETAG